MRLIEFDAHQRINLTVADVHQIRNLRSCSVGGVIYTHLGEVIGIYYIMVFIPNGQTISLNTQMRARRCRIIDYLYFGPHLKFSSTNHHLR